MLLICSRGHLYDKTNLFYGHLREGMRCPMLMSYNRMDGGRYCRRILKEKKKGDKYEPHV